MSLESIRINTRSSNLTWSLEFPCIASLVSAQQGTVKQPTDYAAGIHVDASAYWGHGEGVSEVRILNCLAFRIPR